jgi:hypothetical protein
MPLDETGTASRETVSISMKLTLPPGITKEDIEQNNIKLDVLYREIYDCMCRYTKRLVEEQQPRKNKPKKKRFVSILEEENKMPFNELGQYMPREQWEERQRELEREKKERPIQIHEEIVRAKPPALWKKALMKLISTIHSVLIGKK